MRKNKKGQFVVEFVLALGLWAALTVGFLKMIRIGLIHLRAQRVARLGSFLLSTGRVDDSSARAEMADYAAELDSSFRSNWSFESGRFLETPSARFYKLVYARVTARGSMLPQPITETVVVHKEGSD